MPRSNVSKGNWSKKEREKKGKKKGKKEKKEKKIDAGNTP